MAVAVGWLLACMSVNCLFVSVFVCMCFFVCVHVCVSLSVDDVSMG